MLFNSWEFTILLFITFVMYYAIPSGVKIAKSWQVSVALLASTVFYGWEDYRLLFLLALSCVSNSFATGLIIQYKLANQQNKVVRAVQWAVMLNLLLLFVFKYASFVMGIIPGIPLAWIQEAKSIPLPIGISFYTFHGISMIVDVGRGEITREADEIMANQSNVSRVKKYLFGVRDIGFYLLFFPQLVAGPIIKAKNFWPQIKSKRIADIDWSVVIKSLILGYFFKMVVADNISEQTVHLTTSNITFMSGLDLICLLYGYGFQIFADFAGYSLIAIGLAGLFGYNFPANFNFPYISTSVTEFWQRWHMSLSSWLRDYLYIPLGGNRKGEVRTYLNLFLVMFLGGLWHGAAWKFALWGTCHGLLLAAERIGKSLYKNKNPNILISCLGWVYTFHAVTLLWLTFLMPDMKQICLFFTQALSGNKIHGPYLFVPIFFGFFVCVYHLFGLISEKRKALLTRYQNTTVEGLIYGALIFMIVTNSGAPQGFLYFQF